MANDLMDVGCIFKFVSIDKMKPIECEIKSKGRRKRRDR